MGHSLLQWSEQSMRRIKIKWRECDLCDRTNEHRCPHLNERQPSRIHEVRLASALGDLDLGVLGAIPGRRGPDAEDASCAVRVLDQDLRSDHGSFSGVP